MILLFFADEPSLRVGCLFFFGGDQVYLYYERKLQVDLKLEASSADLICPSHYFQQMLSRSLKAVYYSLSSSPIPPPPIITKTLSHSNRSQPPRPKRVQHMRRQTNNSLLMNIMRQRQVATPIQSLLKIALSLPGHLRARVFIILRIEIRIDDFVAEACEEIHARAVTGEVGSAEVGGHEAEDVEEGLLVVGNFGGHGVPGEGREISVRPGVGSELVAFGVDALEDVGPLGVPVIDVASPATTDDEESGLCAVPGKGIEELVSVGRWPVVEG